MASVDPEIAENMEAERNKTEKQLASLTSASPNAHLREQLPPSLDVDEENFDSKRNKTEKQLASLTLEAPKAPLHEQLIRPIDEDEENCDAMDCDLQLDVPSPLTAMKPESYRYLAALSNEEYEDLLKHAASS